MYDFVTDVLLFLFSIGYILLNMITYSTFVGKYCFTQEGLGGIDTILIFIAFHALLMISLISYLRIKSNDDVSTKVLFGDTKMNVNDMFTSVNCNPFFAEEIRDKISQNVHNCNKCGTFKPPRAHHCSICDKCYLKFDHHCIFLGKCICFQQYKFYFQFLVFNTIFSSFVLGVYIYAILDHKKDYYFVEYTINASVIGASLLYYLYLIATHTYLILNNETTVEASALTTFMLGDNSHNDIFQEGPVADRTFSRNRKYLNPYNLGKWKNWCEVFGDRWYDWFLPTDSTKGDGISFPKNNVDNTSSRSK